MELLFPATVEQAVAMLAAHHGQARIIAGGTDLMLAIHRGQLQPATLVDITRIPGLDQIECGDQWLTIGAAVTFAKLQESPFLCARVPALVQAASSVGAEPIQAAATLVGNIAQAMPAADGGVAAVALGAEVRVVDRRGARWVPVEGLYRDVKSSALNPTLEMISHLRFRTPGKEWGCAWRRVGRRPSLALPILNAAVTAQVTPDSCILAATIALGPVAAMPFRAKSAEAFLVGRPAAPETFQQAAAIARSESRPHSNPLRASAEYRAALIPVMVRDALTDAARQAQQSMTEE